MRASSLACARASGRNPRRRGMRSEKRVRRGGTKSTFLRALPRAGRGLRRPKAPPLETAGDFARTPSFLCGEYIPPRQKGCRTLFVRQPRAKTPWFFVSGGAYRKIPCARPAIGFAFTRRAMRPAWAAGNRPAQRISYTNSTEAEISRLPVCTVDPRDASGALAGTASYRRYGM